MQFLDVGATGAGPPARLMLWPNRLPNPIGASSYCGTPTRLMMPPGRTTPDSLLVGGHVADCLEDHVGAVAAGELADLGDAFLAAGGDDVGGAELAAQVGAGLVAAHEDDLLGAKPFGRQHGQQADGAVADDGDAGALVDPALDGGVVAGAEDVGEGQQGRDERRVGRDRQLDEGAVGQRDADRLGLAALVRDAVPEACPWCCRRCAGLRGRTRQVSSEIANGETTRSPFLTVVTSEPMSSTTPMNSWPIRAGPSAGDMERYGCRSLPQTQDAVMRTSASVGCLMTESGTSSTRTSPAPYMGVARIRCTPIGSCLFGMVPPSLPATPR